MIFETIISTVNSKGKVNFAPFGIKKKGNFVYISPYVPSQTLTNLLSSKCAVVNYTNDATLFVKCITGEKNLKKRKCNSIDCFYISSTIAYEEIVVDSFKNHKVRPTFKCKIINSETINNFNGFNRANFSLIEACILASRVKFLSKKEIFNDLDFLSNAINKTGGRREKDAWKKINSFILDSFKNK